MTTSTTLSGSGSFVLSGETATIDPGTVVSAVTVVGGGKLVVSGVANGTRLQGTAAGQAHEIVVNGGTEQNVTVTAGKVEVQAGGLLNTGVALSGGSILLDAGATADMVVAGQGGTVNISGAQVSTLLFTGGSATVANATVPISGISDGSLTLEAGASTTGFVVGSSGRLILEDGSATGTVISGESAEERIIPILSSGGVQESNFLIMSGGSQIVWNGATVTSGTIDAGGTQFLQVGASAHQVVVGAAGSQIISAGATATDSTIENGGSVQNDGTLSFDGQSSILGEISGSGSIQQTASGATLRFASGALEHFSGTVSLSGGTVIVEDGAEAAHVHFDFSTSGGESLVLGSLPSSLSVSGFGQQDQIVLSGVTSGATLALTSGSELLVESGGTTLETIFLGSGYDYSTANLQLVENEDGTGATLSFGGQVSPHVDTVLSPGQTSAHISQGQAGEIPTGTMAINTIVDAGGRLYVDGTGVQDQISGVEQVDAGGRAMQSTVYGNQIVLKDGVASASNVIGGVQSIEGGTAVDTFVTGREDTASPTGNSAIQGVQIVGSGGEADNTTLTVGSVNALYLANGVGLSDVYQYVDDGASASDTVLTGLHLGWMYHTSPMWADGYAHQIVASGGQSIRTTANANAIIDVQAGGSASDVSLDGGTLILENGALYTGVLTFVPNSDSGSATYGFAGAHTTQSILRTSVAQIETITIAGFDSVGTVTQFGITGGTSSFGSQTISTVNEIILTDLTFTGSQGEIDTAYIGQDDILTVVEGGRSVALHLSGTFGSPFYFQNAPDGGTIITYGVPCYCPGTRITTPDGERPVETLEIGDMVLTASGEARPIRWIGRRSYDGRFAAGNPDILPVAIHAGALGNGLPRRTLKVSPLHAMALEGVLVPASLLANGSSIVQIRKARRVDYIHIELETHDLILAEGAASETFVDDNSRNMFHNAAEYGALYPASEHTPATFCLPRVESGALLEDLRQRLGELAQAVMERNRVIGFVDVVTENVVEGWARCDAMPDEPRELVIFCREQEVGRARADRFRADLTEDGRFSGRFAFRCELETTVPATLLRVEDAATGQILLNPAVTTARSVA